MVPISDEKKDEFIEEAIENIFAVLSEADIAFRLEFAQALSTVLTPWVREEEQEQVIYRRYNCLGQVIVTLLPTEDRDQRDLQLAEEGFTCLAENTSSPETQPLN